MSSLPRSKSLPPRVSVSPYAKALAPKRPKPPETPPQAPQAKPTPPPETPPELLKEGEKAHVVFGTDTNVDERKTPMSGDQTGATGNFSGADPMTRLKRPLEYGTGQGVGSPQFDANEHIQTKSLKPPREFSMTKVELKDAGYSRSQGSPEEKVQRILADIQEDDLHEKGKEDVSHITCIFGLHEDTPTKVIEVVKDWVMTRGAHDIAVRLGDITVFPAEEGQMYDVLKLDVESDDLVSLNAFFRNRLEHTVTHEHYNPHLTLAYLIPGMSWLYVGEGLGGQEIGFDRILFSDKNRNTTEIVLRDLWDESMSCPSCGGSVKKLTDGTPGWRCENAPCEWSLSASGDEGMRMEAPGAMTVIHNQEDWERANDDRFDRSDVKGMKDGEEIESPKQEALEPQTPPPAPIPVELPEQVESPEAVPMEIAQEQPPAKSPAPLPKQPQEPQEEADEQEPVKEEATKQAEEDYKINGVKAKAFKSWFGDWETDPASASKVVNQDTGEPKDTYGVTKVFHGTRVEFASFSKEEAAASAAGKGFYFAENKDIADNFASDELDWNGKPVIVEAYLNIRNPFDFSANIDPNMLSDIIEKAVINSPLYDPNEVPNIKEAVDANINDLLATRRIGIEEVSGLYLWMYLVQELSYEREGINDFVSSLGYDGIVHLASDIAGTPFDSQVHPHLVAEEYGRVWVAFEPNQIKHTNNLGTFNPNTEDMYKTLVRPSPFGRTKGFSKPALGNDFVFYLAAFNRWRTKPDVLTERRVRMGWERGTPPNELAAQNDEEFRLTHENNTQESQLYKVTHPGRSAVPDNDNNTCPDGTPINKNTQTCAGHEGKQGGYPGVDEMHIENERQYSTKPRSYDSSKARKVKPSPFGKKALEDSPKPTEPPKQPEKPKEQSFDKPIEMSQIEAPVESSTAEVIETEPQMPLGNEVSPPVFTGWESVGGQEPPPPIEQEETEEVEEETLENKEETDRAREDYLKNGIKSKSFKAWFGDWENDPQNASKVVDKKGNPEKTYPTKGNGEPLVVYHGTPSAGFTEFSLHKTGSNIDSGFLGTGFYFTNNQETANHYARTAPGSGVYSVYLSIKNPFYWGEKTLGARGLLLYGNPLPEGIHEGVMRRIGYMPNRDAEPDFAHEKVLSKAIRDELQSLGYDGVITSLTDLNDEEAFQYEYVAFEPNQIKSIGNDGTFNPKSRNIHKSIRPSPFGRKSIYDAKCPDGSPFPIGNGTCAGHAANSWDGVVDIDNEPGWPGYPDYAPVVGVDTRPPEEREKPIVGREALVDKVRRGGKDLPTCPAGEPESPAIGSCGGDEGWKSQNICPDGTPEPPGSGTCAGREGWVPYKEEERLQRTLSEPPKGPATSQEHGSITAKYPNDPPQVRPSPFGVKKYGVYHHQQEPEEFHPEQSTYCSIEGFNLYAESEPRTCSKAMSALNPLTGGSLRAPAKFAGARLGKLNRAKTVLDSLKSLSHIKALPPAQHGHQPTLAIDVDGTLCDTPPHTGKPPDMETMKPRDGAPEAMQALHDAGWKIIIWTCRDNQSEVEAWLNKYDIPFDHYNQNPGQPSQSPKVMADHYIDDRAISPTDWSKIAEELDNTPKQMIEPDADYDKLVVMAEQAIPELEELLSGLGLPAVELEEIIGETRKKSLPKRGKADEPARPPEPPKQEPIKPQKKPEPVQQPQSTPPQAPTAPKVPAQEEETASAPPEKPKEEPETKPKEEKPKADWSKIPRPKEGGASLETLMTDFASETSDDGAYDPRLYPDLEAYVSIVGYGYTNRIYKDAYDEPWGVTYPYLTREQKHEASKKIREMAEEKWYATHPEEAAKRAESLEWIASQFKDALGSGALEKAEKLITEDDYPRADDYTNALSNYFYNNIQQLPVERRQDVRDELERLAIERWNSEKKKQAEERRQEARKYNKEPLDVDKPIQDRIAGYSNSETVKNLRVGFESIQQEYADEWIRVLTQEKDADDAFHESYTKGSWADDPDTFELLRQERNDARDIRETVEKQYREAIHKHMSEQIGTGAEWNARPISSPRGSSLREVQKNVVEEGISFVRGIVSYGDEGHKNGGDVDVQLIPSKENQRDFYRQGSGIFMSRVDKFMTKVGRRFTAVFIHEFGHHLEYNVPGVAQATKAFLRHRIKNESPSQLKEVLSSRGYEDDEYGCRDEFGKHFGKDGWYVGKIYDYSSTEILSMGLQALFDDPVGFATNDPEYFNFIIGICTGELRTGE